MVTAGMDTAGVLSGLGMGRDNKTVHLTHDQQLGAGAAGVDIGIETGDVASLYQGITQFFIGFFQLLFWSIF